MIKPLNNHCLIELINDNAGLVGSSDEQIQKGIVRDVQLTNWHMTASAGFSLSDGQMKDIGTLMHGLKDKVVYWEEYSDTGKKFTVDGKDYSLIPFYRLVGYED